MVPRIALIGFSGSGKSLIGRILARRLGWRVIDTDREIEAQLGLPVPQIFVERGEEEFRELETAVLREAVERSQVVISTGGGAVLSAKNRELLARCLIVSLEATADTVYARLSRNPASLAQRPLLQGGDPLRKIREILAHRQPFYAVADVKLDTGEGTPAAVAERIREAWQGWNPGLAEDKGRLERILAVGEAREGEAPYTDHHAGEVDAHVG
ncbi:MAG: shikimate kinase [Dehalococcoidia bacterium]